MHARLHLGLSLLPLLLFAALPAPAAGPEVDAIKAEIDRLQHSLKNKPVTDPNYAPISSMAGQSLKDAAEALDSGRIYLSLEKLLQAEDFLLASQFPVEKAMVVKSSMPAFEAEWQKISQILASGSSEVRQKDLGASSAALRALIKTGLGRSVPLLEGGRGFSVSTKPADGLLYLGQAQGEVAFARFASALPLSAGNAPFPLRSFLSELHKLQEKTNAAFKPPRSIQLHDRFIALNSALKLAQELDSQKSYAGALYQYLEATRHYALLDAPPVDPAAQADLKTSIAFKRKELASSKRDDSLALLFVERAERQINHPDGSAPSADEWRSTQVIMDRVLPAYNAARKTAAPLDQPSGKTVELTLVRWPYT